MNSPSPSTPSLSTPSTVSCFEPENMTTVVECPGQLELKVSPKRLFEVLITDAHHILPKIIPHIFKSIEILEGEGGAPGCNRRISFTDVIPFTHLKDKMEVVDREKLEATINLFEGPMLGEKMESIVSDKWFVASGDGGCILKWNHHMHLKPGHTNVTDQEVEGLNQFSTTFLTAVETYLVAHPET